MRHALALAALILAGGCERTDAGPRLDAAATASATATTQDQRPQPKNKAVLDADGIAFDAISGETYVFPFGAPRSEVDAAAARLFGAADEQIELKECGAGPVQVSRYGPLTLNFQQERLVGWFAREGDSVITGDGIRPGGRMRDLKVARSARMVEGSTLVGEFTYLAADGRAIGGVVSGTGRAAVVSSLHAGTNCFFR